MPDGRHHDPHIEGKLIRAGLSEEVALEEHAGPFAELNNRAGHAFRPEGEVRRSVEGDGIEVGDVADLVRAFCAGVLTGHDIAVQVDGDGVGAVHATFLAQGLNRPPALDRGVEFVDPLAEAKGVGIIDQCLEDRPGEAVQLGRFEAPRPDGCCGVIDIHYALKAYEDVRPDLFSEPGLERMQIMMLACEHSIKAGPFRPRGQQRVNPEPLLRIVEGIRSPQMLPRPVMRDRNRDVIGGDKVDLFAGEKRAVGHDREARSREALCQCGDQELDLGPVKEGLATPKLDLFGGLRDPAVQLGQEVLDIGQLRDGCICDLKGLTAIAAGVIARQAQLDFEDTRRAGFAERLVFGHAGGGREDARIRSQG